MFWLVWFGVQGRVRLKQGFLNLWNQCLAISCNASDCWKLHNDSRVKVCPFTNSHKNGMVSAQIQHLIAKLLESKDKDAMVQVTDESTTARHARFNF